MKTEFRKAMDVAVAEYWIWKWMYNEIYIYLQFPLILSVSEMQTCQEQH